MAYNSELTGLSVDERLQKVVEAQPATDGEAGVGGLIPAPPAGSQTNKKALLSDMTWGDYVTKEYVDNATSAVKWKKQIVASLPDIGDANDQVIYLIRIIWHLLRAGMCIMNILWLLQMKGNLFLKLLAWLIRE